MGDVGILQQGSPCRRELSHRPAPVLLASNAIDQASPFQALDSPGQPAGTESYSTGYPGHALGTAGMRQSAQEFEFPERQAVVRPQFGVQPTRHREVDLAQAAPDRFLFGGWPAIKL